MILLHMLDPEGTAQRKSRKLKQRIYRNKVAYVTKSNSNTIKFPLCRGQTFCGTVMGMIN